MKSRKPRTKCLNFTILENDVCSWSTFNVVGYTPFLVLQQFLMKIACSKSKVVNKNHTCCFQKKSLIYHLSLKKKHTTVVFKGSPREKFDRRFPFCFQGSSQQQCSARANRIIARPSITSCQFCCLCLSHRCCAADCWRPVPDWACLCRRSHFSRRLRHHASS